MKIYWYKILKDHKRLIATLITTSIKNYHATNVRFYNVKITRELETVAVWLMDDILSIVANHARIGSVTIPGNDLKFSGKRKDELSRRKRI